MWVIKERLLQLAVGNELLDKRQEWLGEALFPGSPREGTNSLSQ